MIKILVEEYRYYFKVSNRTILICLVFLTISCRPTFRSNFDFKCAMQLSDKEIIGFTPNRFQDYSDTDLDLLADITTFIIETNGDTSEFEVFYNQRTKHSLVVDVYGLEDMKQIDETVCKLFDNKKIVLPPQTTLLFHKYVNGYNDGGVVVGLKNKIN